MKDYKKNIVRTKNLLHIIESSPSVKHLIITSTQYVYRPGMDLPKNDADYNPHTKYGESKVINEKDIRTSNIKYSWTIIRPTNIWGP